MSDLSPLPHLRIAKLPPEISIQCPTCKQNFKAMNGFSFLTFWHKHHENGERERVAGYLTFDKLYCLLAFCSEEESGHC